MESHQDIRCRCHRLIARLEDCRIEFLCPRCKRKITIDLTGLATRKEILQRLKLS